jgi:hypothetical protein
VLKICAIAAAAALLFAATAGAQTQDTGEGPIHIKRAEGPIAIDGDLSDPGWKNAVRLDKWFETNVSDNGEPALKSVGYLTYDSKFFYAAFVLSDDPTHIRSPYNDRDHIGGNTDDYAGIIIDTRNDKRSGILFLANARGIQYDAASDDSTGEDSSPDFFWDCATRCPPAGSPSRPTTGLRLQMKQFEPRGSLLVNI